jgi:hypothetical protein
MREEGEEDDDVVDIECGVGEFDLGLGENKGGEMVSCSFVVDGEGPCVVLVRGNWGVVVVVIEGALKGLLRSFGTKLS